ncbi:uncharacterized protein LOC114324822 [Diabrotica virgifera virgifera]|uniref:Uncharacterized protein LOC114324822 n=1 Tax=Diabrotica virgifera virgifera TaxID=50390 RepID=A0A6P7F4V4_DIAVI|nr:uncharacterized protein LOC114324822 [Diabrotica virgifera virgifera]
METPVLTKKQLKSTLSAKKQRPKETIKNVLALPFNNNYWPEVSPEDQKELKDLIIQHMPMIRDKQIKVPWKELKTVPKANRKSFRKEYNEKLLGPQPPKKCCSGISFGINSMSKLLEKNFAQAVLLDAETMPRLLVQHLIDQAVLYTVPIICVTNLKETLKSVTGINSVGVAFSKEITSDNSVNLLIEKISHIFKTLPTPEDHINYNRSLEPYVTEHESEEKEAPKKEIVKVDVVQIRKKVYLIRSDPKSRAFIPEFKETKFSHKMEVNDNNMEVDDTYKREVKDKPKMETDDTGFIAFTEEPEEEKLEEQPKQKVKVKYKSLIVKRLKGDPNRNKRKIENLKLKQTKK